MVEETKKVPEAKNPPSAPPSKITTTESLKKSAAQDDGDPNVKPTAEAAPVADTAPEPTPAPTREAMKFDVAPGGPIPFTIASQTVTCRDDAGKAWAVLDFRPVSEANLMRLSITKADDGSVLELVFNKAGGMNLAEVVTPA